MKIRKGYQKAISSDMPVSFFKSSHCDVLQLLLTCHQSKLGLLQQGRQFSMTKLYFGELTVHSSREFCLRIPMVCRKMEGRSLVQRKIKLKGKKYLCQQAHLGNPLTDNQHFQAVECYKIPVNLISLKRKQLLTHSISTFQNLL